MGEGPCVQCTIQYVEKWVVRQPTRTGLVYVECKLAGVEIRYKKTSFKDQSWGRVLVVIDK